MEIPTSLLLMTQPTDPVGRSEMFGGSADGDEKNESKFGAEHESSYRSDGDTDTTSEAIDAAYQATRNGDPKAFKDAFRGAVISMVTEEVSKAMKDAK